MATEPTKDVAAPKPGDNPTQATKAAAPAASETKPAQPAVVSKEEYEAVKRQLEVTQRSHKEAMRKISEQGNELSQIRKEKESAKVSPQPDFLTISRDIGKKVDDGEITAADALALQAVTLEKYSLETGRRAGEQAAMALIQQREVEEAEKRMLKENPEFIEWMDNGELESFMNMRPEYKGQPATALFAMKSQKIAEKYQTDLARAVEEGREIGRRQQAELLQGAEVKNDVLPPEGTTPKPVSTKRPSEKEITEEYVRSYPELSRFGA